MKKTIILTIGISMLLAAMPLVASEAKGEAVTLEGEILDLQCFMSHPENGQGQKHAKCATSCINKGMASGFISEGVVYVLLSTGHDSPKKLVAAHAGKPVKLVGYVVDHGGLKGIQVKEVIAGGKDTAPVSEDSHGEHAH